MRPAWMSKRRAGHGRTPHEQSVRLEHAALIEPHLAEHLHVIVGANLRRHAHPQIAQRAELVARVVEEARIVRRDRRRDLGAEDDVPAGQRDRFARAAPGPRRTRERRPARSTRTQQHPSTAHLCTRKYNARVWIVLAAALRARIVRRRAQRDGGCHRPPDPDDSAARRQNLVDRSDDRHRADRRLGQARRRNRRRAPRAGAGAVRARAARHRRHAGAVSVRALQTDNTTDPALRADVTVRVPRHARDRSRAGARGPHRDRRLQRHAHRRHSPRPDRRQERVGHAAARGRHRHRSRSPTRG